jgi:hypothetical protein
MWVRSIRRSEPEPELEKLVDAPRGSQWFGERTSSSPGIVRGHGKAVPAAAFDDEAS